MDRKAYVLIIVLLVSLIAHFPAVQSLFGYDEFTNDGTSCIQETVENNLGTTCTDCNVSFWLNFPNNTFQSFNLMVYNATSTKYIKCLNLTLVNENTTIYKVRMTANRTAGSIFNGTSDRTIITVYDVWPQVDSQWDVGMVLILLVIQWTFVLLAYRFHEEHVMVKYGFFAIALFFNGWLMSLGNRILVVNGIISSNFTNLFESTETIAIVMNYIFTAYIFIYLLYYMIHSVTDSAKKIRGNER